ncbi:MAG: hypothetical protein QG622_1208 [Actinomycetota bacterium]|nr:hypothetical protein [Actinomycetota bacterium]
MPEATGFLLDQLDGIPSSAWGRFRLDDDDATIGARLVEQIGTRLGNDLYVVTDASWRPDVGPFVLQAWHLSALVREHPQRAGESFFNNDVVILSPDGGLVAAIHHAGMLAVAHGEPSPLDPVWPLAHLIDSEVFATWESPLEWSHLFGEIYPDTAVTLPSGKVLSVRWFETDPQVSFIAPTGDFQISYRGTREDADEAYAEFVALVGLEEQDVMRLPSRP